MIRQLNESEKWARHFGMLAPALMLVFLGWTALAADTPIERLDDNDIRAAVEGQYWVDPSVDANVVDVIVNDGVVTLTGTVYSILEKERVENIAETVKGVRAIINELDVMPLEKPGDSELKDNIEEALFWDPAADSYEVEVKVRNGVATLTGTVDSWQEKQLTEYIVKGVMGVRGVHNELTVNYEKTRTDREIKAEIEKRLEMDVLVDDFMVDVEVKDGRVNLSGSVGSYAEKTQARTDAWVAGVRSVNDENLEIEWWARDYMTRRSTQVTLPDKAVQESVHDAFLYDPRVAAFDVDVEVDDGTAILSGVVNSPAAKGAAERDARGTVGVWRVKNYLKVRPAAIPSDEELRSRIQKVLENDPYVDGADVEVEVENGLVTLSGEVASQYEKFRAGLAAERVKGVTMVANNVSYEHAWTPKPDWEIREDIKDELYWSPFVDEEDVDVTVEDGVVTLNGQVDTWSERNAAIENAWEGGAKDVRDHLSVSYWIYGPYYGPYLNPTS